MAITSEPVASVFHLTTTVPVVAALAIGIAALTNAAIAAKKSNRFPFIVLFTIVLYCDVAVRGWVGKRVFLQVGYLLQDFYR